MPDSYDELPVELLSRVTATVEKTGLVIEQTGMVSGLVDQADPTRTLHARFRADTPSSLIDPSDLRAEIDLVGFKILIRP